MLHWDCKNERIPNITKNIDFLARERIVFDHIRVVDITDQRSRHKLEVQRRSNSLLESFSTTGTLELPFCGNLRFEVEPVAFTVNAPGKRSGFCKLGVIQLSRVELKSDRITPLSKSAYVYRNGSVIIGKSRFNIVFILPMLTVRHICFHSIQKPTPMIQKPANGRAWRSKHCFKGRGALTFRNASRSRARDRQDRRF